MVALAVRTIGGRHVQLGWRLPLLWPKLGKGGVWTSLYGANVSAATGAQLSAADKARAIETQFLRSNVDLSDR